VSGTEVLDAEPVDEEPAVAAFALPGRPGWLHGPDLGRLPRTRGDCAALGWWLLHLAGAVLWVGSVAWVRLTLWWSWRGLGRAVSAWWSWVLADAVQDRILDLLGAAQAARGTTEERPARARYARAVGRLGKVRRTRAVTTLIVVAVAGVAATVSPTVRVVVAVLAVHILGWVGRPGDPATITPPERIAGPTVQRVDMPQLMTALHAARLCRSPTGSDVQVVREWTREPGGRTVTVDLPVPATAAVKASGVLATRLGTGEDMLLPETSREHAGRLTVRMLARPPFSEGTRVPKTPLLRAGTVSVWEPVPLGFDPWGRPVVLDLSAETPGGVIAGTSGAGKSVLGTGFLGACALDPTCRLWLVDGGADTRPWQGMAERMVGADHDAVVDLLRELQVEMDRRIALLPALTRPDGAGTGVTKISKAVADANPDARLGMIVCWVDEAGLYTTGPKRAEIAQALQDLSGRLRKAGGRVFLATTEIDAETLPKPITRNLGWRVALRCQSGTQSRMVTGLEAADGWDASRIDPAKPGVAYLIGPTGRKTLRSWEYTPDQIDQIAAEARRRRVEAGTMPSDPASARIPAPRSGRHEAAPDPSGPTGPNPDGSSRILARVLEVMGGRDRIHSDRLLRGLGQWPEHRGWSRGELRDRLRDAGVETARSVRDDSVTDGGSPVRAGVLRADVEEALRRARAAPIHPTKETLSWLG
jgi:DNA segregation ATPase FtsK/SpoIIIE, S-DNA-T family